MFIRDGDDKGPQGRQLEDRSGDHCRGRPGRRRGDVACRSVPPSGKSVPPPGGPFDYWDLVREKRSRPGASQESVAPVIGEFAPMPSVNFECYSREIVRAILAAVPLAAPWTIAEFCGWFGAATGLEVRIAPWRVEGAAPPKCAALVVVGGRVIVRFDERRSDRHKVQQIMHEFAHLLCDHLGDNKFAVSAGLFTRGLDMAKIGAVVQRQALDSEAEVQAEIVGTHLAVMSHEVIRLSPAGASCLPAAIVRRGAKRRVQVLASLWEALTAAAPEVRLCDALSLRSPAVAVHRMFIEIEDALMTLASVLTPPGDGSAEGWVTSIADALVGREIGAPASALGFSLQWPNDERVVLDIARAWMRRQERSSTR